MTQIEKIRQEIERRFWSFGTPLHDDEVTKKVDEILDIIENTLSEEPDKSLEEAAEEYADNHGFRVPYDGSNNYYDEVDVKASKEGFKAGAEWQASQMPMPEDTVLFNKGVAEGRRLEREDMLKDAVEGYVSVGGKRRLISILNRMSKFKYGDKVRIVVLKEEEE